MPSCSCQAADHNSNHANPYHRLTVIQANFIISAQAPRLKQPAERAFYYPSSRQDFETFNVVATADNLQSQFAEGTQLLHPVNQGSEITAVGPDDLQSAIQAHQRLDQWPSRIAILYASRSNHHCQNQAQTVHRHMTFAPRDLLARIVAACSRLVRGLDRLAVHDGRRRGHPAAFGLAHTVTQNVVNELPRPVLAPNPEVTIDGLPRTKVTGQKPPGTARSDHVKDGVEQTAPIQRDRSTTLSFSGFGGWHQRLDPVPFVISQVSWIMSWMRLHPSHL